MVANNREVLRFPLEAYPRNVARLEVFLVDPHEVPIQRGAHLVRLWLSSVVGNVLERHSELQPDVHWHAGTIQRNAVHALLVLVPCAQGFARETKDRKSTRLNSSHQ